jgi:transcriptional regulator with XRE-family HTH domain
MSEFGKQLTRLRTESRSSLKEICRQVGIPPSRLIELERGIRIPTSGQIKRLESFYGLDSGALAQLATSVEAADSKRIE